MILLGIARPPQLVQVARHRAGGAHDDVARGGRVIDRADDLALRRQRFMTEVVQAVDLAIPLLVQAGGQVAVGSVNHIAAQPRAERGDAGAGIADQRQPAVLMGIEVEHVEVDEVRVRVAEDRMRRGREVRPARANPDHDISLARQAVGRQRTGRADGAQARRMVVGERSFASLGLPHRNSGHLDELPECAGRIRIDDAAAGHDHGSVCGVNHGGRAVERAGIGLQSRHAPDSLLEKLRRILIRFRLDILGKRERHRTRLRGVGENANRLQRRRHQLLGPRDPVPVAGDRLERIVDGRIAAPGQLELLQDRVHAARGEDIARQQQDRQAVDRRQRRAGDHVGGARSDRAGAGHRR